MLYADRTVNAIRLSDGSIVKLEYRQAIASTAKLAKEYARAGYPDKYVIFSESQSNTQITGTKLSDGESEHGVFLSCILRPSFFPSQAGLLGALSSVALLTGLAEHTEKKLGIGWVSDIFCNGRRIGGVAIEGKLDSFSSYEYLIVSFAVKLTNEDFPPKLIDMIRKVFENDNASIEMIIAKNILNKFFTVYHSIKSPEKFMKLYKERSVLIGKTVKVIENGKRKKCRVADIDSATGALIVDLGGTKKTITRKILIPSPTKVSAS